MKTAKRIAVMLLLLFMGAALSGGCAAGQKSSVASMTGHDSESLETGGAANTEVVPEEGTADHTTKNRKPETEDAAVAGWRTEHRSVKGIYVTGQVAGSAAMDGLITLVDETELNAMVIDIKNDDGNITYKMDLDSANELGACVGYIADMKALMAELKEHDIYTIARIVCFKDPCLAGGRPELVLRKPDGTVVADANGLAFVNPYREEAWEYIVDVAIEASDIGFDEIQFDYVRFPIGEDADIADYGVDADYTKEQAITNFFSYAAKRLHQKGIVFGADVFGTIIGSRTDMERVGQDYQAIGGIADVLSPMVYPSHYANGAFGLDVPDAHPYETILGALQWSQRELEVVDEERRAVVRPWLQSFTATWIPGHIPYEEEEVRKQIQAVYDAGYEEWILWNAANDYPAEGLLASPVSF